MSIEEKINKIEIRNVLVMARSACKEVLETADELCKRGSMTSEELFCTTRTMVKLARAVLILTDELMDVSHCQATTLDCNERGEL
jgi:hypothetical protein